MLHLSQEEIEGPLQLCFPHGSLKEIHIITGIGRSYLEQWINKNDDRKSPAYEFLQIQCALDQIHPEHGERHFQQVMQFRELSLPSARRSLDLDTESLRNHKESFDVAQATMAGVSLYDQLKEILEQEAQVKRHKKAVLQAINAEKESFNGSNSRYATNGRH